MDRKYDNILKPIKDRKFNADSGVTLNDYAIVDHNGINHGKVTLITPKGIGIRMPNGYIFVKWINVLCIEKMTC